MDLLKRAATLLLVILLAALLPNIGVPRVNAQSFQWDPGDFRRPLRVKMLARTFVCRSATYSLGVTKTMDVVWQNLGIPAAKRTAMLTAAQQYKGEACGNSASRATTALRNLVAASDGIAAAFATKTNISLAAARDLLGDFQTSVISNAMACGASTMGNVQSYLAGGSATSMNIVGQPISGPSGGLGIEIGALGPDFSCDGAGGGGGGGGGVNLSADHFGLDSGRLEACMANAHTLSDSCPLSNPDNDKGIQKQIDDAAKEDAKRGIVTVTTTNNTTYRAPNGSEVELAIEVHDTSGEWRNLALSTLGVVGAIVVGSTAAAPVAVVAAAIGVGTALVVLWGAHSDLANAPKYDVVVKPKGLCPMAVGGQLVWWANPSGDRLNIGDAFTLCSCAAAVGVRPDACRGQGQQEADRNVGCSMIPYATPGEAELCAGIVATQHPEVGRERAKVEMCAYKDCGAFSTPGYSAATDACGCSNGGGIGGGVWIPEFGWTDPYPLPLPETP